MSDRLLTYIDLEELSGIKARFHAGDPTVGDAVAELAAHANKILRLPPTSVLDKTSVASSGNRHDFYAIGGYSWPNPTTPDGLPYQYRDSHTNPEALASSDFDKGRYEDMTRRVAVLSLAYFYTDQERYAVHAATLLRTWFIRPETRMNPHFRYAAARPGLWDGHFSGAIEGVVLIEMLDYVSLIERSKAWTVSDDGQLRAWFRQLGDWLAHSAFGRREIYSTNNHGSYLLAQIIVFSTYSGNVDRARRVIPLARKQLRRQIRTDGSMPLELERADSLFYSVYGLRAFAIIARSAERYDVDLWREGEALLSQAFTSLAQYLTGAVAWPFPRKSKPWEHHAMQMYLMAARAYGSEDLLMTAHEIARHAGERVAFAVLIVPRELAGCGQKFALPAGKLWPVPLSPVRKRPARLQGFIWRGFGVLAARGLWRGRALP